MEASKENSSVAPALPVPLNAWRFFLVIHVVALVAMPLLLVPGLDASAEPLARAGYVAGHPVLWRLGWLPWQLCALSDIIVTGYLLRWAWRSRSSKARLWAVVALVFNLAAALPEQWAEWMLVTRHVDLAVTATMVGTGLSDFVDLEVIEMKLVGIVAGGLYLGMTAGWHLTIAAAAGTSRAFTRTLNVSLLALAAAGVALAWQFEYGKSLQWLITGLNAIGFPGLLLWALIAVHRMGLVESVDEVNRPHHQKHHEMRWPKDARFGWLADAANSVGLRQLLRPVPFMTLRSEVTDVVYLNWLVPTERAVAWLPETLRAQDYDGLTPVSLLTYRHGGFGPGFLGPLRRLLPSPLQSNWRFYLEPQKGEPSTRRDAVYFFRTTLSLSVHATLARLVADGLPAHFPSAFVHERRTKTVTSRIEPTGGSAPPLLATVVEAENVPLPAVWQERFGSHPKAVAAMVEQNRAIGIERVSGCVFESRIEIPIDVTTVERARLTEFESELIADLVAGSECFAFVVPTVWFAAIGERPV